MSIIFLVALRKTVGEQNSWTDRTTQPLGTGAVYSFDPVGSYEREACRAAGAAQSLLQPFLDNQASSPYLLLSDSLPTYYLLSCRPPSRPPTDANLSV
jgi:hypothetical protein